MSSATLRRSSWSEILLALQAQVVAVTGLDASRVILTAFDEHDVPHFGAQQDVSWRARASAAPEAAIKGGGWVDDRRTRSLDVVMRTELFLDQPGQSPVQLTDATAGTRRPARTPAATPLELFLLPTDADRQRALAARQGGRGSPTTKASPKDKGWVTSSFSVSWSNTEPRGPRSNIRNGVHSCSSAPPLPPAPRSRPMPSRFLAGEPTPVASSRITHAHYDRDAQAPDRERLQGRDRLLLPPTWMSTWLATSRRSSSKGRFISAELDMLGGGPV